MGKVTMGFSMSLDGFVAGPHDSVELSMGEGGDKLFKWFFSSNASIEVPIGTGAFKMSQAGADAVKEGSQSAGVLVTARRTFDIAHAWGGRHPMNVPIVVVTHTVPQEWVNKPGSPFTFVTDGVESAIRVAREIAGDKAVVVGAPSVAKQCIQAGLMDEISIDLIPVLLGGGVSLFGALGTGPIDLECTAVSRSPDVIHLTFRIRR